MTKKLSEKYNDSCIKLFEFIKMLYNDTAEFKKVIDLFSDGKYDGTSNTHVTLNKYLNALKIFGIRVKKIKHKYKMLSPLYKISFNNEDLRSINKLKDAESLLPEGLTKQNFDNFINELEIRYDENTQNLKRNSENLKNLNFDFYYSSPEEQIKLCEKYCQDNMKLEIIYNDDEEINIICSPIETVYLKRRIYLKVLGNSGSRIYEIPLDNIKSIKQLPSSSGTASIPSTVVYRIKNRLAKNYKMKEWEHLDKIESDGNKIIINKNEDFNILLKRLMKYGTECELISPRFLREEMINLINKTLSNYQ